MAQSPEIKDLAAALAKAQSKIKGAVKDSNNPFFNSQYADLASVWDACREQLTTNGLAVTQAMDVHSDGKTAVIITTLMHVSGQWTNSMLPIVTEKNTPQGIGSAITYMRRYALAALVGVPQIDDDAEAATDRRPVAARPATNTPPVQPAQTKPAAAPKGVGAVCYLCGAELVSSKSGKGFYCPNFKDGKGEHTLISATQVSALKAEQDAQGAFNSEVGSTFNESDVK